jgi:hypothetical protein
MSVLHTFSRSLKWLQPRFSKKSSVGGSADGSSIDDDWEHVPSSKPDNTLARSGEDHNLAPPDSKATTTHVPDISQLIKYPEISAVGRLYPEDTYIRRSRQGTDRITDIILPKHRYTKASVVMIPFEDGKICYDPEASYLTVYGDDGPQKRTFKELGNYEIGHSTADPANRNGYIAAGPNIFYSDWAPKEVLIFGNPDIHHDEDDQEEYPDDMKVDLVDPFITIRKIEPKYY